MIKNMKLQDCKTVEEVEALGCNKCARNGHWGWCDAPWIECSRKNKIKEILGNKESRFKTIEEQMSRNVLKEDNYYV